MNTLLFLAYSVFTFPAIVGAIILIYHYGYKPYAKAKKEHKQLKSKL